MRVRDTIAVILVMLCAACGRMEQSSRARPGDGAVIYQSTVLTMDPRRPMAEAVLVKDGAVLDLGSIDDLVQAYSGASFDERFLRKILMPAFVDVRLPPDAPGVLVAPCRSDLLTEEIVSMGAKGAPVRVVAMGRAALSSAIEAVRGIPDEADIGRVSVEARGPVAAGTARLLTARGVPLILSGDPAPENCDAAVEPEPTSPPADPMIAGRIALAPANDGGAYLAAAGAFLPAGGSVRLSPQEALEAITADAAYALGAEAERGVIGPGRRARFAVLDRNPLATPGDAWGAIGVEAFEPGE